ncbi:MAG TPA: GDSL-type esterase/lipase family protein [Opitutaceae bacterium]|nr:GDSL-type esterase/lipase family protein [Opitutaceae bacterium]
MRPLPLLLMSAAFLPSFAARAATPRSDAPAAYKDATAALGKLHDVHFMKRHAQILQRDKQGPVGLVFLGDSITEMWSKAPEVWKSNFAAYHPANFGIGGDFTQNVIWRIENGELDGISPRVVVLMIGTNNTLANTAPEIVSGIHRILDLIRARQPQARILLLALLPRGPRWQPYNQTFDDAVHRMQVIREVNRLLPPLADGHTIRFLDLTADFTGPDGQVRADLLADKLHPSPAGYAVIAKEISPLLREMMR